MKLNRRNVLVGLATATIGGGAAFGSGAFSTVEADRTVSVDTAGDASAYLGISVDNKYAVDGNNEDAIQIDLGDSSSSSGFNDNAVTTVNSVLTLTNNAADNEDIEIGFGASNSKTASKTLNIDDSNGNAFADVTFELANGSLQTIGPSSTSNEEDVNVTVNTSNPTGGDGQNPVLTIVADDADGS